MGDILIIISASDTEFSVIFTLHVHTAAASSTSSLVGSAASTVEINQIQFAASILFTVNLSGTAVCLFFYKMKHLKKILVEDIFSFN